MSNFYYVDFSCWGIFADNETDAFNKAREILEEGAKEGKFPTFSGIELVDPDEEFSLYTENVIEME